MRVLHFGKTAEGAKQDPQSCSDTLARMTEAEDTLRAIGAGEVDAFVLSDGGSGRRVFTLSTADRPYRIFVENMRDGAATVSANGLILYANQRLATLLSCSPETIVESALSKFIAPGATTLKDLQGPEGLGTTMECSLRGRRRRRRSRSRGELASRRR